jgi:lycopene cyclase domain-containing protein
MPCSITAFLFLVWDALFARVGVWSFNPRYTIGAHFAGLPLEEYLFFFCIPYSCVFTYYCVSQFLNLARYQTAARITGYVLIVLLLLITFMHLGQLYTSLTFLFLGAFLLFTLFRKALFLPAFYVAFLIILVPFFISNGILTGTGLPEPVVIYNNNYNLGIRMLTIPVEDTFYGMLLMLMNVLGFEYLRNMNRNLQK